MDHFCLDSLLRVMHLGKAKHANAGVTKLPAMPLKLVLLDKAAHASRRLTRTFRDATWPFPAPSGSADSTISILSKMRCLAYAMTLSVGPGTALGTGFMPGCSWRGQQKFSIALTHRHSDSTSFYSRGFKIVSGCLTQTPLHGFRSNSSPRLPHLLGS